LLPGFELITDVPLHEIKQMQNEMERGSNPKDYKIKLAKEIVSQIHGGEAAENAYTAFENTFKKGQVPEDILQILANSGELARDLLVREKVVASNGEWKRLIDGNAVTVFGTEEVIHDPF
jgi:tyrosyl-tRNA synthetase